MPTLSGSHEFFMPRLNSGNFDGTGELDRDFGMPLQAMSGIRDSRTLSGTAKIVAIMLVLRASMDEAESAWTCFPSLGCTGKDCGLSSRQVQRGLHELRAAGLVTWTSGGWDAEEGRNLANTYCLDLLAMEGLRG